MSERARGYTTWSAGTLLTYGEFKADSDIASRLEALWDWAPDKGVVTLPPCPTCGLNPEAGLVKKIPNQRYEGVGIWLDLTAKSHDNVKVRRIYESLEEIGDKPKCIVDDLPTDVLLWTSYKDVDKLGAKQALILRELIIAFNRRLTCSDST